MEGSRTTALCDIRLRLWRKAAMHTWLCPCDACAKGEQVHAKATSTLLCLESAILLPLNYIRATGAHKPRQNGEPRQPRHLDTSTASTPTSTPRRHPHMESALTDLDRPRHKPRHRLDRGSTASTPRQPGLCASHGGRCLKSLVCMSVVCLSCLCMSVTVHPSMSLSMCPCVCRVLSMPMPMRLSVLCCRVCPVCLVCPLCDCVPCEYRHGRQPRFEAVSAPKCG